MAVEIFFLNGYLQKIDFNNDGQINQSDIDYILERILNSLSQPN